MKKLRVLALVMLTVTFCAVSVGCSYSFNMKENVNVFSQGRMFKNDEFGITMKIPDDWLHTKEERDSLLAGVEEEDKTQTVTPMLMSKYPVKSGKTDNACVTWSVQNMSMYPNVDSKAYAIKGKQVISSQLDIVATKGPYSEKIDGIDFCVVEYKSPSKGVFQKYYSAIIKGYAHTFCLIYMTPEDLNTCNEILKSITIRK